jgi:hypothetical protein
MTTATQETDGAATTDGRVREIALPPDARALSTLPRIDYTDAFLLDTGYAQDRTGEEWARALVEEAPAATRKSLRQGWFWLGLRLGSTDDDRLVLGWPVHRSSEDFALLTASSLIGMEGQVLCKREQHGLLVATIIQLKNPIARLVWAATAPQHRRFVRHLLKEAGRRAGR